MTQPMNIDKGQNISFPFFSGVNLSCGKSKYYFMLLKNIFEGRYRLEHVKECYCGSSELEVLSTQDRFGLPFGTKICRSCGLIQLSPRLCAQSLPDYYNEIYRGLIFGESYDESDGRESFLAHQIYKYLKKYAINKIIDRELTLVEIGCGTGFKLNQINEFCAKDGKKVRAIGCDYSAQAVKIASARNIECRVGNAASLSGEKADIVMLSHIIEHLIDIKKEFADIKKLMKAGSYLYVEAPGVGDLVNKVEYQYNYLLYSVMAHMYCFNLTSLRSVIEPLGFEFIAGDEYIRSIFVYNPSIRSGPDVSQNYNRVLSTLRAAEAKRRKIEMSAKVKFKNFLRKTAKRVLKIK